MTLFPLAVSLLAFMLVSYCSNTESSTRHVTKESQTSNLHHRHSFWIVCDIPCQQWGTKITLGGEHPLLREEDWVWHPYSPMCCHSRGQLWQKSTSYSWLFLGPMVSIHSVYQEASLACLPNPRAWWWEIALEFHTWVKKKKSSYFLGLC